jgi:hypothetical protein
LHHYCRDQSLFSNLTLTFPPPDMAKDPVVLGKGNIVIPISNNPKIKSIRLKDVFFYLTEKPRNIINLSLLQKYYPKLMLER